VRIRADSWFRYLSLVCGKKLKEDQEWERVLSVLKYEKMRIITQIKITAAVII